MMSWGKIRLRAAWLIAVPFFVFARPTVPLILGGAACAVLGLGLRAWSAGTIRKNQELTTGGPYAYTRNPLYLGSFLIGLGVSIAGGHLLWPALFVVFFVLVYGRTMAREEAHLVRIFPDDFPAYREAVPTLLPRLRPAPPDRAEVDSFRWSQFRAYREWEASLGTAAAFGVLLWKAFGG